MSHTLESIAETQAVVLEELRGLRLAFYEHIRACNTATVISDEAKAELEGLRFAVSQLSRVMTGQVLEKRNSEQSCIKWLLTHMQTATTVPTLSTLAREFGVDRRMLRADKWSQFRETYDRLVSLQTANDVSRAIVEELIEDDDY